MAGIAITPIKGIYGTTPRPVSAVAFQGRQEAPSLFGYGFANKDNSYGTTVESGTTYGTP